ncbi:MAG: hypothetical protein HY698_02050 [Deltaproteobacteria bacterium]|nr:hypothetical protein [Deltaproteobacteria bacterium]
MGRKNWNQDYFKLSGSTVEDEDIAGIERAKLAEERSAMRAAARGHSLPAESPWPVAVVRIAGEDVLDRAVAAAEEQRRARETQERKLAREQREAVRLAEQERARRREEELAERKAFARREEERLASEMQAREEVAEPLFVEEEEAPKPRASTLWAVVSWPAFVARTALAVPAKMATLAIRTFSRALRPLTKGDV